MTPKLSWLAFGLILFVAACDDAQQGGNSDASGLPAQVGAGQTPAAETPAMPPPLLGAAPQPAAAVSTTDVFVNRVKLDQSQLAALVQYGQPQPGRYWYDNVSGLWGLEGGPYMGKMQPGLNLGGPMPADISGGGTGTFFNGREIHPLEYQALQQAFGVVYPGRFWLQADGTLGPEGGAAIANLTQTRGGSGGGGSSYSPFGGSVGQDSNGCSYFTGTGSNYNSSWSNC